MKSIEQVMPSSIRLAAASDAADIARIQASGLSESITAGLGDIARDASTDLTPPKISENDLLRAWSHTLSKPFPGGTAVLVALHGRTVVAVIMGEPEASLHRDGTDPIPEGTDICVLEVDKNFRRSGHASRLISAFVDTLHPACLRIWITAGDQARIRFVTSAGFRPAGLRRTLDVMGRPMMQHLWWSLVAE